MSKKSHRTESSQCHSYPLVNHFCWPRLFA